MARIAAGGGDRAVEESSRFSAASKATTASVAAPGVDQTGMAGSLAMWASNSSSSAQPMK